MDFAKEDYGVSNHFLMQPLFWLCSYNVRFVLNVFQSFTVLYGTATVEIAFFYKLGGMKATVLSNVCVTNFIVFL